MNVVYRGVPNPISIAVNNAKSYKITGEFVKQNENGKYAIYPDSLTETKVYVEIEKLDGSKVTEVHYFRIKKGFPAPIGTINEEYSTSNYTLEFKINEIENAEIGVYLKDFLLIETEVKQYSLKVQGYPTIIITGNKINSEAYELIKKAKRKDYVVISNIKTLYKGFDGGCIKNPSVIVFKIK